MKLILTSAGFVADEIIETAIRLVGRSAADIKVAAIAEGYAVESGDHRWVLDDLDHATALLAEDGITAIIGAEPLKIVNGQLRS